jgi:hypothetical protein
MTETYRELEYQLIELPRLTPTARAEFVLAQLIRTSKDGVVTACGNNRLLARARLSSALVPSRDRQEAECAITYDALFSIQPASR